MRLRFILGTAVLAAALPVAAASGPIQLAENDQHHEHEQAAPQHSGNQGAGPQHGQGQMGHGQVGHGNMGAPGQKGGQHHTQHNNMMGGQGQMNGSSHGQMMMGGHNAMTGGHANIDRRAYQRNFNAPRHYHASVYNRPHGWYEHRWVYGEILPALFWTQNYWLTDYYDFGLADPPPGFVWVRYGDDALLVDQNSGEVLQVEYAVFD